MSEIYEPKLSPDDIKELANLGMLMLLMYQVHTTCGYRYTARSKWNKDIAAYIELDVHPQWFDLMINEREVLCIRKENILPQNPEPESCSSYQIIVRGDELYLMSPENSPFFQKVCKDYDGTEHFEISSNNTEYINSCVELYNVLSPYISQGTYVKFDWNILKYKEHIRSIYWSTGLHL